MKPKRKSNKESAATLFNRYVWLADTIRRAGRNEKKAEGGRRNEQLRFTNYELRLYKGEGRRFTRGATSSMNRVVNYTSSSRAPSSPIYPSNTFAFRLSTFEF